jgi:hypothetical protein
VPTIEKSAQLSETVPLEVPPPVLVIVNVRVTFCPTTTVPKSRESVDTTH